MKPDVLRAILDARDAGLHVHLPGQILSYNENTQRATVRVMTRIPIPDYEDELDVLEQPPDLQDVLVLQPQAGGFFVHFPVQAGDGCLIEFLDYDPSGYEQTGQVSEPVVRGAHTLGFPVALLGYGHRSSSIVSPGAGLTFGAKNGHRIRCTSTALSVGGDSDAAALASVVDVLLEAVRNAPADPEANPGFAALKAALVPYLTSASQRLKLGG